MQKFAQHSLLVKIPYHSSVTYVLQKFTMQLMSFLGYFPCSKINSDLKQGKFKKKAYFLKIIPISKVYF